MTKLNLDQSDVVEDIPSVEIQKIKPVKGSLKERIQKKTAVKKARKVSLAGCKVVRVNITDTAKAAIDVVCALKGWTHEEYFRRAIETFMGTLFGKKKK